MNRVAGYTSMLALSACLFVGGCGSGSSGGSGGGGEGDSAVTNPNPPPSSPNPPVSAPVTPPPPAAPPVTPPPEPVPAPAPVGAGAQGGAPTLDKARAYPAELMTKNLVTFYGATPDDGVDDTMALRRAFTQDWNRQSQTWVDRVRVVDHYYGRPTTIYVPPGTYRITEPLQWIGCAVSLVGAGPDHTIIELPANTPGFGDADNPLALIASPGGNHSFRQNIDGLTIRIGAGNPGAIALDYIANNSGAITDVRIEAAAGSGHTGINMTRQWPRPLFD